jgi:RIO kinase 1
MLLRDVDNLRDFFGRFAPELLATQFGAEIWALYTRSVLQPATRLTGRFEDRHGPVDVASVLRVVGDARDEEEARLLRMRTMG